MLKRKINVGCIGDSITQGIDEYKYPAMLQAYLGDDYHVYNFGLEGACSSYRSEMNYRQFDQYQQSMNTLMDIIVIMFGTNDSNTLTWIDKATFKKEYANFIENYTCKFKDALIYLCTIPCAYYINGQTSGVALYDIQPEHFNDINDAIKEVANDYQLEVIDIYDVTSNHSEWFKNDGIHPDKQGMNAIALQIYQQIMGLD